MKEFSLRIRSKTVKDNGTSCKNQKNHLARC
nr:MAG TPA: hypothetical protein [Caudoviricetes sp.]